MWHPKKLDNSGPRYAALVAAIETDINAGRLLAGDRLPPQRDLADRLKLSVGTVVRAYRTAEEKGLISGEVGRGTYVRAEEKGIEQNFFGDGARSPASDSSGLVDLSLNVSPMGRLIERIALGLRGLGASDELGELIRYNPHQGVLRHRESVTRWISTATAGQFNPAAENTVICNGAQHALATVVAMHMAAGGTLLAEKLTYPGIKAVASDVGFDIAGVAMDEGGLDPNALDEACEKTGARVLYTIPTLQNPTGITISAERRQAIAKIARKRKLTIVEDDVYGFLAPGAPPPIATLYPEGTAYIGGFAKSLAPGLRVGYAVVPQASVSAVTSRVRATGWMTSPIMVEMIARWIDDGTAQAIVEEHRLEATKRCRLAIEILGPWINTAQYLASPSFHIWLNIPPGTTSASFALAARAASVIVTPPKAIELGSQGSQGVRISLGAARNEQQLHDALNRLRKLLLSSSEDERILSLV